MWEVIAGNSGENAPPSGSGEPSVCFPETQTAILAEAAAGNWDEFLRAYLAPCWREIRITCLSRRIPLDDADDLFQELVLRIIQEGRLKGASSGTHSDFAANIPGRFLQYREISLRSAKFRTVLKSVVRNLILEYFRDRRRRPKPFAESEAAELVSAVDQSVARSVQRQWLSECLLEAASRLQSQSRLAKTRGKRRLFTVLYRSTVGKEPAEEIADDLHVDRTTISGLLSQARRRFVKLLQEETEIEDSAELKHLVMQSPELVIEALKRVQEQNPD